MIEKEIYLNPKQQEFLQGRQKTKVFLGGRGCGKSHSIGYSLAEKITNLKRGKFFLASTTFSQILTKTLPGLTAAWDEIGWKRDKHYALWRTPPKNFKRPWSAPEKFKNVISFKNGSCIELLSLDRPDLARGGSYDGGEIDEAALLKKEDWTRIILPSIRGNTHRFADDIHQNTNFYTSIPRKPSGYWILDYEQKFKANPDKYLFTEANAYDNIEILKDAGIERMREELDYLEFEVEVMNRRIHKAERGFYHKFDIESHTYTPQYDYEFDGTGYMVKGSKDVKSDELIELSFDFGGWFNCCTAYQEREGVEYCVKEFYQKGQNTLSDLIRDVVKHFAAHKYKLMRVWGEPRGHNPKDNALTSYQTIKETFASCGWACEIEVPTGYKTEFHSERYDFINELLLENRTDLPKVRFNYENAANLILTLQTTEVNEKKEKDKSREKDRDYPQEKATHLTDSFDYYIMQKYGWLKLNGQIDRGGEVMVL